jgi:hypothetical protein
MESLSHTVRLWGDDITSTSSIYLVSFPTMAQVLHHMLKVANHKLFFRDLAGLKNQPIASTRF